MITIMTITSVEQDPYRSNGVQCRAKNDADLSAEAIDHIEFRMAQNGHPRVGDRISVAISLNPLPAAAAA